MGPEWVEVPPHEPAEPVYMIEEARLYAGGVYTELTEEGATSVPVISVATRMAVSVNGPSAGPKLSFPIVLGLSIDGAEELVRLLVRGIKDVSKYMGMEEGRRAGVPDRSGGGPAGEQGRTD